MFVIIAVPAILLDWGMVWAESVHSIDPVIIQAQRFQSALRLERLLGWCGSSGVH